MKRKLINKKDIHEEIKLINDIDSVGFILDFLMNMINLDLFSNDYRKHSIREILM